MMRLAVDEVLLPLAVCKNIDDIMWALEKLFILHRERFDPTHYCINVKVHHLPLTRNQEIKALARLETIWDEFINPWIANFKAETGHQIYTEGRSGGYMYVDQVGEILDSDENPEDLRDRLETLPKFYREWQAVLKDAKSYLNRTRMPREDTY